MLNLCTLQCTFFWTLLVNQILQYYYANPKLCPKINPLIFQGSAGLSALSGPPKLSLSPKEDEQIKEIFDLFDTDGGGTMDKRELDAAKFALGFDRSKQKQASDRRGQSSDLITLEEFSSMMKGDTQGRGPYDSVWMVFSLLSQGGSESGADPGAGGVGITLEAVRQACQTFSVRLSEDETQEMMAEADPEGSGRVDLNNFFRIVGSAPWF